MLIRAFTVLFLIGAQTFAVADQLPTKAEAEHAAEVLPNKQSLDVAASFVAAGGGASNFSSVAAFSAIMGTGYSSKEIIRLNSIYAAPKAAEWIDSFDYFVTDADAIAKAAGMPMPVGTLQGQTLAEAMVKEGSIKATFQPRLLLNSLFTRQIAEQAELDLRARYGSVAEQDFLEVSDKALGDFYRAYTSLPVTTIH